MNDILITLALIFTIAVLALLLVWREKQNQATMRDLLKAFLAENLTDFTSSSIIEQEQDAIKKDEKEKATTVPLESIDDAEFGDYIKKVNQV